MASLLMVTLCNNDADLGRSRTNVQWHRQILPKTCKQRGDGSANQCPTAGEISCHINTKAARFKNRPSV